ncbi:hypothetical protein ACIPRD_06175 [Streptomyces sp. NPDC090108]|uniref:hypothetical protein n=1 Tax=Streptomyces sp. NPDC090108 TaxID=3365947 RepID=UPI0038108B1D
MGARLVGDPDPGVRAGLAGNPGIGEDLVRALADGRGHDVRRALAHHPRVPLDVLGELASTVRIGPTLLPRIAAASPAEVERLARSPHPVMRMLLAERRDLPAGIRDQLAADPDAKVVKSVAPHPGLSPARLRNMIGRHGAQVAAAVAANPDAPADLLEELAGRVPPAGKALRRIAGRPDATAAALLACLTDRRARPVAAVHPALPPRVLIGLLSDEDAEVARAAAANPSLPRAVMEDLVASAPAGASAY